MRFAPAVHKPDYRLLAAFGVLLLFGLIMLSSASSAVGVDRYNDASYFLKRQLLLGVLPGLLFFSLFARLDYHILKRIALPLFIISFSLLVLVLIPGVGQVYNGARRWFNIAGFSLQPSELMKLALIIYLSAWLDGRGRQLNNYRTGLLPFLAIVGGVFLLIVAQPDLGTAMTIGGVAVGLYFLANAPFRDLGILGSLSLTGLAGLIAVAPYRMERLLTFLHPERDPLGDGYHINQALLAIGSGGFWGRGYGHSRAKFQYLPEVSGDSIFAVIGEELGFAFSLMLIALYGYIFLRIFRIAENAPETFGRLLAAGIGIWFFVQMLVNVGAMVALFPLTGVPLPFVSYGGTALMTMLTGVGILMSISKASTRA